MVSANFIASDYCYSLEMTRALERHKAGESQVIPVILRACDWHGAPFGKLRAAPTDGRPVTSWQNQDEAFTDIATSVREAVGTSIPTTAAQRAPSRLVSAPAAPSTREELPRSSNLRIKHEFSDFDRETFLSEAFNFISRFFCGSLRTLEERHKQIKGQFEKIDSRCFEARIYRNGQVISQCTVNLDMVGVIGYGLAYAEIRYAHGTSSPGGGATTKR